MSSHRGWFRRIMAALLFAAFLSYLGSYLYLSRRGDEEAKRYGMKGFLYVPVDEVIKSQDMTGHYVLECFYSPINLVDMLCFDGPAPCAGMLFKLSR